MSTRVDAIFTDSNTDYTKSAADRRKARLEASSSDEGSTLQPGEFAEALIRIAAYRYARGPLPERLRKLLVDDVIPNAQKVDPNVFRRRLASPGMHKMFKRHKKNLSIIFDAYAKDDMQDVHNLGSMSCREVITMCMELGLVGSRFGTRWDGRAAGSGEARAGSGQRAGGLSTVGA